MSKPSKPTTTVTITCSYCHKDFTVDYKKRDRRFCSKSCVARGVKRRSVKKLSTCLLCEKEFYHYGERILCGKECVSKYFSQKRVGENNPAFKHDKTTVAICKHCNNEFDYTRRGLKAGYERTFCSRVCWFEFQRGKNRALDGPSENFPYPKEFTRFLKKRIRKRDNYTCCLCGVEEKSLSVHHINYDKEDCEDSNFVCLCKRCHGLTNHQRPFWTLLFTALISNSKLVKKPWGCEVWIVNNSNYCLKYLIFFQGQSFSYHWHLLKQETWHCLMGEFDALLDFQDESECFHFKQGDKIELEPGIKHQLRAIENSIIVEVSTQHFDEDSVRDNEIPPE